MRLSPVFHLVSAFTFTLFLFLSIHDVQAMDLSGKKKLPSQSRRWSITTGDYDVSCFVDALERRLVSKHVKDSTLIGSSAEADDIDDILKSLYINEEGGQKRRHSTFLPNSSGVNYEKLEDDLDFHDEIVSRQSRRLSFSNKIETKALVLPKEEKEFHRDDLADEKLAYNKTILQVFKYISLKLDEETLERFGKMKGYQIFFMIYHGTVEKYRLKR